MMPVNDVCDLCGLTLRYGHHSLTAAERTYRFCCIGCKQVFSMLITASGVGDPSQFRDTDLFKQCRDLGIIPVSEDDLRPADRSPEVPITAAAFQSEDAESPPCDDTAAGPRRLTPSRVEPAARVPRRSSPRSTLST